jgi:hypothetical protein
LPVAYLKKFDYTFGCGKYEALRANATILLKKGGTQHNERYQGGHFAPDTMFLFFAPSTCLKFLHVGCAIYALVGARPLDSGRREVIFIGMPTGGTSSAKPKDLEGTPC